MTLTWGIQTHWFSAKIIKLKGGSLDHFREMISKVSIQRLTYQIVREGFLCVCVFAVHVCVYVYLSVYIYGTYIRVYFQVCVGVHMCSCI